MATPSTRRDLKALHRIISQANLALTTIPDHPNLASVKESLRAALALSKDLATRQPDAAALGAKGGAKTAERGPEYYAQIAAMRKTRAGGRPKKGN